MTDSFTAKLKSVNMQSYCGHVDTLTFDFSFLSLSTGGCRWDGDTEWTYTVDRPRPGQRTAQEDSGEQCPSSGSKTEEAVTAS